MYHGTLPCSQHLRKSEQCEPLQFLLTGKHVFNQLLLMASCCKHRLSYYPRVIKDKGNSRLTDVTVMYSWSSCISDFFNCAQCPGSD